MFVQQPSFDPNSVAMSPVQLERHRVVGVTPTEVLVVGASKAVAAKKFVLINSC